MTTYPTGIPARCNKCDKVFDLPKPRNGSRFDGNAARLQRPDCCHRQIQVGGITMIDLTAIAARVRSLYYIEPLRMERAVELYSAHKVKHFTNPDSLWHVESSVRGHYTVNEEKLTCNCPDWTKHNDGQEGMFICKHLASVLLARHVENENRKAANLGDPLDVIMNQLFGTPLTAKETTPC